MPSDPSCRKDLEGTAMELPHKKGQLFRRPCLWRLRRCRIAGTPGMSKQFSGKKGWLQVGKLAGEARNDSQTRGKPAIQYLWPWH